MKPMLKDQSKDWPKCPEGQWIARLTGIVDLGTQVEDYQGTVNKRPKIYLQFEVFAENEDGSEALTEDGHHFMVGQYFTASMSPKGKLLPFVNAWRGKPLEDKDFPFDFNRMLGRHCLMSIVVEAKDGKTYAKIGSIAPVPKRMAFNEKGDSTLPESKMPQFFFNMDSDDWGEMMLLYETQLWDGIRKKIALSPEFQARMNGTAGGSGATVSDDDIPF